MLYIKLELEDPQKLCVVKT